MYVPLSVYTSPCHEYSSQDVMSRFTFIEFVIVKFKVVILSQPLEPEVINSYSPLWLYTSPFQLNSLQAEYVSS